jgi:predicted LPLAT superfamily acyltransferase
MGPFVLATTFKVPVVFVGSVKQGLKHFALTCTRPRTYLQGKKDIPTMLSHYTFWMETMIKRTPLQWHNYFPFWEEEK